MEGRGEAPAGQAATEDGGEDAGAGEVACGPVEGEDGGEGAGAPRHPPPSQPENMYVYLFGECLVQNQPPTSPATPPSPPSSPGGLEMNYYFKECSVPNSSSELIFVKIRAESGPIFSKNPSKTKVLGVCRLFVISVRSARYFAVWQTAQ